MHFSRVAYLVGTPDVQEGLRDEQLDAAVHGFLDNGESYQM